MSTQTYMSTWLYRLWRQSDPLVRDDEFIKWKVKRFIVKYCKTYNYTHTKSLTTPSGIVYSAPLQAMTRNDAELLLQIFAEEKEVLRKRRRRLRKNKHEVWNEESTTSLEKLYNLQSALPKDYYNLL